MLCIPNMPAVFLHIGFISLALAYGKKTCYKVQTIKWNANHLF